MDRPLFPPIPSTREDFAFLEYLEEARAFEEAEREGSEDEGNELEEAS